MIFLFDDCSSSRRHKSCFNLSSTSNALMQTKPVAYIAAVGQKTSIFQLKAEGNSVSQKMHHTRMLRDSVLQVHCFLCLCLMSIVYHRSVINYHLCPVSKGVPLELSLTTDISVTGIVSKSLFLQYSKTCPENSTRKGIQPHAKLLVLGFEAYQNR